MIFEPAPANDFLEFMREYHRRCRARVPQICAVAAKWAFEDLIPGLSDFDTRFILADGMATADWSRMSLEVGAVHTELCREVPRWARNLEHLPGVNLTVSELCEPVLYYPEFQQWTFYEGDAAAIARVQTALEERMWSARDELYQFKRFATFCGAYQRGIDPAVNLGPWENKYPLHSRCMHYFAPPVQAAVSLLLKLNVRGKMDALKLARGLLPQPEVIDKVLDIVARHYEVEALYEDPAQANFEAELENYLSQAWRALAGHVTLLQPAAGDDRQAIRAKVNGVSVDPVAAFFESAKFGRLLKGRLLFYAESIPWFDSTWPAANELQRIGPNFYTKTLSVYGLARFGEKLDPEVVLDRLSGGLLLAEDCREMRRFFAVASEKIAPGRERDHARRTAECYDGVLRVTEILSSDLLRHVKFGA